MGIDEHPVDGAGNTAGYLIEVGLELGVIGLLNSPVGPNPDGASPGQHNSQGDADLALGHTGRQFSFSLVASDRSGRGFGAGRPPGRPEPGKLGLLRPIRLVGKPQTSCLTPGTRSKCQGQTG
jgi:hypothetical protein